MDKLQKTIFGTVSMPLIKYIEANSARLRRTPSMMVNVFDCILLGLSMRPLCSPHVFHALDKSDNGMMLIAAIAIVSSFSTIHRHRQIAASDSKSPNNVYVVPNLNVDIILIR